VPEGKYRVLPLAAAHDRSSFRCGVEPLDRYFREQVTQDVRRRVTACFVAVAATGDVAGFYTLASASVLLGDLPVALGRKLPRYPSVPAVRMGRLAVDCQFAGRGLGGALLADALVRVIRSEIAAWAVVVEAKNEEGAAFYRHHGFVALPGSPRTLFLPLASVPKP